MARYRGTVTTPHPVGETWRYLADLRSIVEWDPSVESARLVSGEPGTVGSRYELVVGFAGSRVTLSYETVAVDPPTSVVFAAETDGVSVRDEARIGKLADGGSSVVWDADLRLKGKRRLADPALGLAFNRLGRRAERGLAERLNELVLPSPLQGARS